MQVSSTLRFKKWTHALSLILVILTFGLILLGGIVHSTQSSLACPDWPLCFGQFFPKMEGKVFWEHGHRLAALLIILLTLLLNGLLFIRTRREPNTKLSFLGVLALAVVCCQALWGGLTVLYGLPILISTAHLATSMLFLAILIAIFWRTSSQNAPKIFISKSARIFLWISVCATYLQIIFGAFVRHAGAGLVCVDFPLCHGQILPMENHLVMLHALHRLGGVLVAVLIWITSIWILPKTRGYRVVRILIGSLPSLVCLQIFLGYINVTSGLSLHAVTTHLGMGALLWGIFISVLCQTTGQTKEAS